MLPFGVGATIGGAFNLITTRIFCHWILRFYGQIQPGGEMLFVPEST